MVSVRGILLAPLAHDGVERATGNANNADGEERKEGTEVELRAREAKEHRAGVRLVDALVLLDVVPARQYASP